MPEISTVRIADEDHRMSAIEGIYYKGARSCCSAAISTLGVEMGISIHLSGTFRELRKHVSVEELQQIGRAHV